MLEILTTDAEENRHIARRLSNDYETERHTTLCQLSLCRADIEQITSGTTIWRTGSGEAAAMPCHTSCCRAPFEAYKFSTAPHASLRHPAANIFIFSKMFTSGAYFTASMRAVQARVALLLFSAECCIRKSLLSMLTSLLTRSTGRFTASGQLICSRDVQN